MSHNGKSPRQEESDGATNEKATDRVAKVQDTPGEYVALPVAFSLNKKDKRHTHWREDTVTPEDVYAWVAGDLPDNKYAAGGFLFAELTAAQSATCDCPGDEGSRRHKNRRSVTSVTALVLDLDYADKVPDVLDRLRESGWAGIFYTSASTTEFVKKYRVILWTSRPMTPAEHWFVAKGVMNQLGAAAFDQGSAQAERTYYLPAAGQPEFFHSEILAGEPVDVEWELDAAALAGIAPRGERCGAAGASGVEAAGTAYADLSTEAQEAADARVSQLLDSWRHKFKVALDWPEGYRDFPTASEPEGRGWELLCRDFEWALGAKIAEPWADVDEALAYDLYDEIVPEEIRGANHCRVEFNPGVADEVIYQGGVGPAPEPRPRVDEVFGVIGPQCRYVDEDGERCTNPTDVENGWHTVCVEHQHTPQEDWVDPDAESGDEKPGSTWKRQDLAAIISQVQAGDTDGIQPTVCETSAGGFLLYPGRIAILFGESGSGKTWLALLSVKQEIENGRDVVFIDFEDDAKSAVIRLLSIGAKPDDITTRFHYIAPEESLSKKTRKALIRTLDQIKPSLVVIDSTGESLALEGKNPNADEDVATWVRLLPKACTGCGAAVAVIDHIPKEGGSAGPIGSQRKRAAAFAAYRVETEVPFAKGAAGRARVVANKDKAGNYRKDDVVAMLQAEPGDGESLTLSLEAKEQKPTEVWKEALFSKICAALETALAESGDEKWPGASTNHLTGRVKGDTKVARRHIDRLVDLGFIRREKRGQTNYHYLESPYVPGDVFDDESTNDA